MGRPCLILLRDGAWNARRQAVSVALTAASFGAPVVLALSGEPLRAWVAGAFDDGAPGGAEAARVGSLRSLLDEGRSGLGVRVVACDTEIRLAGLDGSAVAGRLDAVMGLPEQWRHGEAGHVVAF